MRQTWTYSDEEFGKRMEAVRGERTQEAFATELGLHKNTLRNYELGERQPDSELIARFCQHTGVLPEWLLFGERQQLASQRDEVERLTVRYAPPDQMLEDYVLVPRFESPYRVVEGHLVRDDEVVGQVAFRKSWVLGTMGLMPDKLAAVSVLGDSVRVTLLGMICTDRGEIENGVTYD